MESSLRVCDLDPNVVVECETRCCPHGIERHAAGGAYRRRVVVRGGVVAETKLLRGTNDMKRNKWSDADPHLACRYKRRPVICNPAVAQRCRGEPLRDRVRGACARRDRPTRY